MDAHHVLVFNHFHLPHHPTIPRERYIDHNACLSHYKMKFALLMVGYIHDLDTSDFDVQSTPSMSSGSGGTRSTETDRIYAGHTETIAGSAFTARLPCRAFFFASIFPLARSFPCVFVFCLDSGVDVVHVCLVQVYKAFSEYGQTSQRNS
ncbi:hypothetical protein BV25DRAFT_1818900 [Artomyces pyxidatus]|uniref:Uncharacterized protein n=1 Tax=Artomyces pyxidatus TaxID=48021 RepID=A0ACB8TGH7_9AGAM|nr:hypothetical protein BV25DRAFT_1818900 [Artomyces pyxidatus]